MTGRLQLTESRRGAWIINCTKHLLAYDVTDPRLSYLEGTCFAGKCGSLLIKLSADDKEQLALRRVKAHARLCGINTPELNTYLNTLQAFGCIDWDVKRTTYEVLAFSRERVLATTSQILANSVDTAIENVLLEVLEFCLLRPRLKEEIEEYLAAVLRRKDRQSLYGLIETFGLLGVVQVPGRSQPLYFNEYQFGDRSVNIGTALAAMSRKRREELNILLDVVESRPGVPPEDVQVSEETKTLAIHLGLVEVSQVSSPGGTATFLTLPLLAGPSVGQETEHLQDDVFHHSKMLLSSLRFGELRSSRGRGRIIDPPILVQALLDRDRVGPCTAIGQDYVILEGEGVIRTIPAPHKPGRQFYMELRRREAAEIVLGLLESGASEAINARSLPRSLELPLEYASPEASRARAARRIRGHDPDSLARFLEELRS